MATAILARQVALLVVALLVPTVFLLARRERAILTWVGATLFVQVFDTAILTNLPAGRIVGVLALPLTLASLPRLLANRNFRYAALSLAYVGALGIFFGFIFPWPDITGSRPLAFRAEGKTVIYLSRMLADLSLAVFVFLHARFAQGLDSLRRGLLAGAILTSMVGIFEALTHIDFYTEITGLGRYHPGSAQGLSYEPRGLGLAAVWGFFLILAPGRKISPRAWIGALICLAGLVASGSFSAGALFVAGSVVAIWVGLGEARRSRRVKVGIAIAVVIALIWLMGGALRKRVSFYLDVKRRVGDVEISGPLDAIAFRLDVFDGAALAFLSKNPLYAIVGTGPGLISLPASSYVPPGVYSYLWSPEEGINSPPTHGPLLELANGGIVGLALWLAQVIVALRRTFPRPARVPPGWSLADWVFFGRFIRFGVVFYVVQNSVSPLWATITGNLFTAAEIQIPSVKRIINLREVTDSVVRADAAALPSS